MVSVNNGTHKHVINVIYSCFMPMWFLVAQEAAPAVSKRCFPEKEPWDGNKNLYFNYEVCSKHQAFVSTFAACLSIRK